MGKGSLRSWPLIVLVALAAGAFGAGCGDDNGKSSSADLQTISAGKLKVGSYIPFAPFEFGSPPGYEGFDIDLVNEIGKRLGLQPAFVKTPYATIFKNLANGRFDMVASAATITPARKKIVDFSYPYFAADQSLMVKRGSDIRSAKDLAGKIVGAQSTTTGAKYAKQETKAKTVRTYASIDDAFKALQSGLLDAVINDFPVSKFTERSMKDLVVVQTLVTGEQYGLAFQKNADALRDAVNGELDKMKKDGTYADIYRKWLDSDPPESILKPGNTGSNAAGTEPVK
jgi:ABC-type amino acid transport substrate-binding protein